MNKNKFNSSKIIIINGVKELKDINDIREDAGLSRGAFNRYIMELGYGSYKELKQWIKTEQIKRAAAEFIDGCEFDYYTYKELRAAGLSSDIINYIEENNLLKTTSAAVLYNYNGERVKKTEHPLHIVWGQLKCRTGVIKGAQEHHIKTYISKGVKLCPEWLDFNKFYNDMMALGWFKGSHISRHGDAGDYCPGNVAIKTAAENIAERSTDAGKSVNVIDKNGLKREFNSLKDAAEFLGTSLPYTSKILTEGAGTCTFRGYKVIKIG